MVPFSCMPVLCGCVGRYIRSNLNMPASLPTRGGGHRDYDKDCPITVFGSTQARLVGQFNLSVYLHIVRLVAMCLLNNVTLYLKCCVFVGCRWSAAGKLHSHRLCLLLTFPSLCADGSEHPTGCDHFFINVTPETFAALSSLT